MKTFVITAIAILAFAQRSIAQGQTQSTVAVQFCPLYLALQNRCPTTTTTPSPSTSRRTTPSGDDDNVDSCGYPVITFCPDEQQFMSGGRNCTNGRTIQIRMTTLAEILIDPSQQNAAAAVGASYANALGDTFSSVAKSIQAQPTQATIGVTFIPAGELIGAGRRR